MDKYQIKYGVLGEQERQTYGLDAGLRWREAGLHPLFKTHDDEIWGKTHE